MIDRLHDLGYSITEYILEEGCIDVFVDKCSGATWVEIQWDLKGPCKVTSHNGKKNINIARTKSISRDLHLVYELAYRILTFKEA